MLISTCHMPSTQTADSLPVHRAQTHPLLERAGPICSLP